MSYRVRGRGFGAHEGRSVYWIVGERSPSERDAIRVTTIRDGEFEDALGPIEAGRNDLVSFYVDVDGDEACDATREPAGYASEFDVDLVAAEYRYEIAPTMTAVRAFCDRFTPSN